MTLYKGTFTCELLFDVEFEADSDEEAVEMLNAPHLLPEGTIDYNNAQDMPSWEGEITEKDCEACGCVVPEAEFEDHEDECLTA